MGKSSTMEKLEELYGAPSGYSKERHQAFFKVEKEVDDVIRDLNDAAVENLSTVYVFPYEEGGSMLSVDY